MIKRYKHNQERRAARVRGGITNSRRNHRICVTSSNKYIYAQLTDITAGKTLAGSGGKDPAETGKDIAGAALKLKIKQVVFDRGSSKYHGRVKLLAEAARKAGLEF